MANLKDNWQHQLVGEHHVFSIQAGSDQIAISKRNAKADEPPLLIVPINDLRDILLVYEGLAKK